MRTAPARGDHARPLPEHQHRDHDGDEGPVARRKGIDDREVAAAAVGAVEQQEVGGVQHAAAQHQQQVGGPNA